MNVNQIEKKLKDLVEYFNQFTFIYDLLSAYNLPKASITRLKKGNLNLSKNQDEIIWKKKLYFKEEFMFDLHETIIGLKDKIKHNERFIIVTDYKTILAIDTVTEDKLDCKLTDLPKHYDFFLPWAGMEKTQHVNENPADVKAAEKMAKLFDAIKIENPDDSEEFVHGLNVFLSRLLFCFFAEDTNIFEENQFTNAVASHTQSDGSDLDTYLDKLFEILNTPEGNRGDVPSYLNAFPYVNGGLFKDNLKVPKFNRKSRQAIIDSGELDWAEINPDIFGSMFQAVINVDQRGNLGQHYTSVPNIMKVIEPLFLDELKAEFHSAKGNKKKLSGILERLQNIKIFDSACGSGNFLIIAYKELRKLEIKILEELKYLKGDAGIVSMDFGSDFLSHITLNNFYGIEVDDFAHEIAKLALWLAEHQMNLEFFRAIGKSNPTLPLKDAGQIIKGNACRVDWSEVCPKGDKDEIYLLGNPPYLGGKSQSKEQKEDMSISFDSVKKIGELDYIAAWFYKASKYVNDNCNCAFVTTNSICQGSQVQQLWPLIFNNNVEILFAYQPFYWANNAKHKAAVIVTIIGIGKNSSTDKYLYYGTLKNKVKSVSPYLIPNSSTIVFQKLSPLSRMPEIKTGNSPYDGGNLIFTPEEKDILVKEYPETINVLRKLYGSYEFINDKPRWCLWLNDSNLGTYQRIETINKRINATKEFRENGGQVAKGIANRPHQFRYTHEAKQSLIIIPRVSSERRKYIPFGFLESDCIVSDSAQAIYDPEPFVFSIINSMMHMIWVRTVGGKLKNDFRYSSALCYNTFPFPNISKLRKEELTLSAFRILEAREKHTDKTLAELYDPDKMPEELRIAHELNDAAIEKCYRVTPFGSDEERLEYLFKLYEKMMEEEHTSNTLFQKQKPIRKKKV